jgi:folate-binding protein YgfZ
VGDAGDAWAILSLIGPASAGIAAVQPPSPEHALVPFRLQGTEGYAITTDLGLDLIAAADRAAALRKALCAAGAAEVSEAAAEIRRVESGRPRFGAEMSHETMPAEAGIIERAIDFEKGCYIGQEPVARLHYKGRANRHLRGLLLSGPARVGDELSLDDRTVGSIGTACLSPALGPIALAIVRHEAEPGATLQVGRDSVTAKLIQLPFELRPGTET